MAIHTRSKPDITQLRHRLTSRQEIAREREGGYKTVHVSPPEKNIPGRKSRKKSKKKTECDKSREVPGQETTGKICS